MSVFPSLNVVAILELLGTFAFAISGIRLASGKQMDWFGAYVIGLVTAVGGGTTRDLLLDVTPFWIDDPQYLITTGIALLVVLLFKERLFKLGKTIFLFDTIGLGLFTVSGISKCLMLGSPVWVCIVLGTITGSVGGVIRDIIINEVPLLFRKDIYALSCILGGLVFFGCTLVPFLTDYQEILAIGVIILIRVLAAKFHLQLPRLLLEEKADSK